MFNAVPFLTVKDVQLTIRLSYAASSFTSHSPSYFQNAFYFNISLFFFFFFFILSSHFVLSLLEYTFLPLGQAYIEFHCQKIKTSRVMNYLSYFSN